MPTWSELSREITTVQAAGDPNPYDTVRRKYLAALAAHSGRDTILYASRFMQPGAHISDVESIIDEDLQALLEVTHGLYSKKLDLIIHSPGGSAEATESIVSFLRRKYTNIRAIIPQAAMSAATMWACAADRIVMGPQSSLGPIDPQLRLVGEGGSPSMVPAQAILDQFEIAREECRDPRRMNAWIPMLRQYGPALLVQCHDALDLSENLVKVWLREHMLAKEKYASRKALRIARALSDHKIFMSHARHIDRDWARSIGGGSVGLKVDDMERDQTMEDLVMSVFHATMHVFTAVPVVAKIVENQNGRAFVKIAGAVQVVRQAPRPGAAAPAIPPSPDASPTNHVRALASTDPALVSAETSARLSAQH